MSVAKGDYVYAVNSGYPWGTTQSIHATLEEAQAEYARCGLEDSRSAKIQRFVVGDYMTQKEMPRRPE